MGHGGWRRAAHDVRVAVALGWLAGPGLLAGQAGLLVAVGLLPAAAAWLTKLVFDELVAGRAGQAAWLAAAAATAGALAAVAAGAAGYLSLHHNRAVGLLVQERLYDRANRYVGLRPFEDPAHLGRLRLAEEAAAVAPQAITGFALALVHGLVVASGFAGALVVVWPPMVLLLIAGAIPTVLAQLAISRRQAVVAEHSTELVRRRVFYQGLLTDVRAAQEVRLFGLAGLFSGRMADLTRLATGRQLAVERRAAFVQGGLGLLSTAVAVAGSIAVLLAVGAGRTSIGDYVLFGTAVVAAQAAVQAIVTRLGDFTEALRLFGSYTRVLEAPEEQAAGSLPVPPLRHGIEFRDVWFRYRPGAPWVLSGVSFTIPSGSSIGLVGLNGAGKTTLVKLLCRFYDPERGEIRWDGTDLRDLDPAGLRQRLGATFQDFMTYDLSAAENIGLGDLNQLGDRTAIEQAAARAEVHEALKALPRGYDTLLSRVFFDDEENDCGTTLSGGSWQRLAVARALMRTGADLLVLDEPSSGLDAEAEHRIHRALHELRAGRTCVLISHRLSAIRDADLIVVLSGGKVVERGDHESLMLAGGEYARLFSLQANKYQDSRVAR
jgi:ATP-binding cassette, subfamily B, bacterial